LMLLNQSIKKPSRTKVGEGFFFVRPAGRTYLGVEVPYTAVSGWVSPRLSPHALIYTIPGRLLDMRDFVVV
jgi:hypothetical protein